MASHGYLIGSRAFFKEEHLSRPAKLPRRMTMRPLGRVPFVYLSRMSEQVQDSSVSRIRIESAMLPHMFGLALANTCETLLSGFYQQPECYTVL
jgi:hypothetical protein